MHILVVGGSGLVGSHVMVEARKRGHEVLGTFRNYHVRELIHLDLGNHSETQKLLARFQPDWVVHAAGWTWVDGCEKDVERANYENCIQPSMLAALCKSIGSQFAYFSTTYIFDGKMGPYAEDDEPNPLNVYAKTKWTAEQKIQEIYSGEALIPRIICVWGTEHQAKNFVYQTIKALRQKKTLSLPSDQIGNPTWAGDIAWWLLELVEKQVSGVWNLASNLENWTRIQWFCAIRDAARASGLVPNDDSPGYTPIITKELGQTALRPLNAGARIDKILSFAPLTTTSPHELKKCYFTNDIDKDT